MMNRLATSNNIFQGTYKKVLCVCTGGVLRSPTAAVVLSQEPFNFNTRAAGIDEEIALIPVDEVLLSWADEIVCMETKHKDIVKKMLKYHEIEDTPVKVLNIPDRYSYRDRQLIELIKERYEEVSQ